MLVYLALLAVLLIDSEVKNITEISQANQTDTYTDLEYNDIDLSSDCGRKTCVLKCCDFGQVLNDEGVCYEADNVEELNRINNYVVKVDTWHFTSEDEIVKHKKVYHNFAFVQNEELVEERRYTDGLQLTEFYILKTGFLKIKVNSTTETWILAAPLEFCVNTQLSNDVNEQEEIRIIVKSAAERIKSVNIELLKYVAGGMLVSLLLLGLVIYRMSSAVKRLFGSVLIPFTFSLVAVYLLTAVQIILLRAGKLNAMECRIISPLLYFFFLSSFFWVNIISYDAWSMIRNFRKYSIKINKDANFAKIIRFNIIGWVVPFMLTTSVIVVDILKLDLVFPITKPPFENCLANDEQMMYYTHIPISILMATNCMFFLMNIYNILMLQRHYNNVVDITAILVTKRRFIQLKVLAIIGVSVALELMPHVPIVLYCSMHANNILLGGALCTLSIYEKCTYTDITETSPNNSNFMNFYRKVAGTATRRMTINTIFLSKKNNDDLQGITSAAIDGTATEGQHNRF